MERILSVAQMRAADEWTINKQGIPSEVLVARAGKAVAEEIIKRCRGGRVLVCIGKGNNGEDGKIIAQILAATHGFTVRTLNVYNGIFKVFDNKFDIIVDCIFGTGLNRDVDGKYKTAIEKINESNAFVVSCDIPSGLNGDSGLVMGVSVRANLTVAIQELKTGYFLNYGPDYVGKLVKKDIGISVWGDDYILRIGDDDARKLFESRPRNVNKGNYGKAVVIGGSKSFPGSVLLAYKSLCALKMGTGYSCLAAPDCLYGVVVGICPECIMKPLKSNEDSLIFDEEDFNELLKYDSVAIGMGLTASEETYKAVQFLLTHYDGRLLIDADGLNALALYGIDVLKNKKCRVVITPHIGEFARLVKKDKSEIISNLAQFAKEFAQKYGVTVVLKSAVSIITDGQDVYLNTTGCSALAKGGSGDLLSGFISGLAARHENILECALVGAYVFGKAGEYATKNGNEYTVTATDVIAALPQAINSL